MQRLLLCWRGAITDGKHEQPKATGTWPAAWAALAQLDGDAWDTDRLDERWKQEYRDAFMSFAMSRNWDRENAEVWCDGIVGDALMACRGADVTPTAAGKADVRECEWESRNAI